VQQLAVVADEQHRLAAGQQRLLQPALARHVQEVVRLVEQQDLLGPAQQGLERQPLLLATGQGRQESVLAPVVRHAQRGRGADVPQDLGVIPARVAPVRERLRVRHLSIGVLALHHGQLGQLEGPPGGSDQRRREVQQQVPHLGRVPDRTDELPHHTEPAVPHHSAVARRDVTRDDTQQRRLAGPVGPDQRGPAAVTQPKAHAMEQRPAVGQHHAHALHVDVTHPPILAVRRGGAP